VGQALVLSIDISTDRWFATGSQVQPFTIKNVVMQANNVTTINGSKRISGQTWATQTHEITLYPTEAGNYHVDPIRVDISVNTKNDGVISGSVETKENSFSIEVPDELVGIDNYIVSPQVTLNIEGQFEENKDYAIGEAITQTITITARNTPAMMIPPIDRVDQNTDKLNGISIYRKPVQLFDKSNRGELQGTRIESFTYIFESSGRYVIDEHVLYWWNSQLNSLEQLVIPASIWTVSGDALSKNNTNYTLKGFRFTAKDMLALCVLLLMVILLYSCFIKYQQLIDFYKKITGYEKRLLRKKFINATSNKNYLAATQYLYQYQLMCNNHVTDTNIILSKTLNSLAFNDYGSEKPSLKFTVEDAKRLIKQVNTRAIVNNNPKDFPQDKPIELNCK
jgi:hypothetical protein